MYGFISEPDVGEARNRGFAITTGKDILFVDSDNEIEIDAREALWNCAEKEMSI